jgi:hypothetical protein
MRKQRRIARRRLIRSLLTLNSAHNTGTVVRLYRQVADRLQRDARYPPSLRTGDADEIAHAVGAEGCDWLGLLARGWPQGLHGRYAV